MRDKIRAAWLVIGYMLISMLSGCALQVNGQPVDTGGTLTVGTNSGELYLIMLFALGIVMLARKND